MPRPVRDRQGNLRRHPAAGLVPGERVGPYRVEYEFGSGGMGRVYAARHGATGRPVAIKVLRNPFGTGPLDGAEGRRRLYREAIALSKVRHPNVPALHAVDHDDRVGPYVVLERVEGVSLTRWRQIHTPSTGRILDTLVQVARALAACHEAGLVHRDVKPTNVLVEPSGRAVLVDFGLAVRPRPADAPVATTEDPLRGRITDVGTVLGTNGYIAPELVLGRALTYAADQFCFGVLLFEALCGKRPYEGATAVAYARAVRDGARRAFSCTDAPDELPRALDRMLAVDPGARFASMRDVAKVLERCARKVHRSTVGDALRRARGWWRAHLGLRVPAAAEPITTSPAHVATTELQSVDWTILP